MKNYCIKEVGTENYLRRWNVLGEIEMNAKKEDAHRMTKTLAMRIASKIKKTKNISCEVCRSC